MRLNAARLNRGLSDELPKDRPEVSREIAEGRRYGTTLSYLA